jgi:imidazolonepropionase
MTDSNAPRLFVHNASQLLNPFFRNSIPGGRLSLEVIRDGAALIEGDRILAIGPSAALRRDERLQGSISLDVSNCVVGPGFVDSHTHPVFASTRHEEYEMRIQGASYESIAAAGGGIRNSVRTLRAASELSLLARTRQHCHQFLAHGTTTIEAKSGYGLDLANELKILQVIDHLRNDPENSLEIIPTFLGAHEIPDEYRDRRGDYVDLVCDKMIPMVAARELAMFCDVFCEAGVFSVEESRRILKTAESHGLGMKLHADQLTHSGGTRLAVELGAASADHLEYIDDCDIALLASSSVVATLLPGASFHLGATKFAPARKLLEAGVTVALATDFNPGTSPTVNMQAILSIAGSSLRMTPEEAFAAATLGGARALRLDDRLGSLTPGKQADLVVYDVEDYRLIPYHYGMNHVRAVIKKGRIVFDHGSLA